MTNVYTSLVETAKVAARDILRMRKISKWLSRKSEVEAVMTEDAKAHAEYLTNTEKRALIAEYEATNCPTDHPGLDDKQKRAVEVRDEVTKTLERAEKSYAERKESDEKRLAEINTAIAEWCDGVRKVSADELAHLTDELIKSNVTQTFSTTGEAVTKA
jgi:hypothetical protein